MHEAATNPSMEHKERVLFSGYFRSKRRPKLPSVHRYVVPIKQASFINGTWKVASFPQKQKVEKEKKSKQTDLPRNSESPRKGVVFFPTQCVSEGKPRGLIDPPDRGRRPRFRFPRRRRRPRKSGGGGGEVSRERLRLFNWRD